MISNNVLSFPWVQQSAGSYRQKLDSFGRLWINWHRNDLQLHRAPILLASYARIRCKLGPQELEDRLRLAWTAIRYGNPAMACEVDDFYRTYCLLKSQDVEKWLLDTFKVATEQCIQDIIYAQRDVFHPVLYFHPDKSGNSGGELLIVCHHFFNDGRGTFHLFDALLKFMESPVKVTFGDEARYLPLARNDIVGLPSHPSIASFLKAANIVQSSFSAELIGVPRHENPNSKHHGMLFRMNLSEMQTTSLLQCCKDRGVSVTAAFKTALMFACEAASASSTPSLPQEQRNFAAWEMFDFRPWAKEDMEPIGKCGTDYHGLIPSIFNLKAKTFDEILGEVDAWFKTTRREFSADPAGLDALDFILQEACGGRLDVPNVPIFGSYGVLEQYIGRQYGSDLEVEDTWSAALANEGTHNGWWIDTFRDKFRVVATCNDAFYDIAMFQGIMKDTLIRMMHGLGLSGSVEIEVVSEV